MSSVETSLSYAALILADADVEISSDNLLTLLKNANIEADKIWADLYSKALEGKDLKEFFFNFSAAPAAGAVAASGAASGDAAAAEEEAEKEEEAAEESDADMGFGLFD